MADRNEADALFATKRMKKDVLRAMNIFYDFSD